MAIRGLCKRLTASRSDQVQEATEAIKGTGSGNAFQVALGRRQTLPTPGRVAEAGRALLLNPGVLPGRALNQPRGLVLERSFGLLRRQPVLWFALMRRQQSCWPGFPHFPRFGI